MLSTVWSTGHRGKGIFCHPPRRRRCRTAPDGHGHQRAYRIVETGNRVPGQRVEQRMRLSSDIALIAEVVENLGRIEGELNGIDV